MRQLRQQIQSFVLVLWCGRREQGERTYVRKVSYPEQLKVQFQENLEPNTSKKNFVGQIYRARWVV